MPEPWGDKLTAERRARLSIEPKIWRHGFDVDPLSARDRGTLSSKEVRLYSNDINIVDDLKRELSIELDILRLVGL